MTGHFFLDWAALSVSLFNTILLLWLGLTVLLNAERRTWGIWLAGGSLLAGGVFFISHTAILGYGRNIFGQGLNFWWHAGWGPAMALPLAWYVITLWYSGYWEKAAGQASQSIRERQRGWFALVVALTAVLGGLLLFANPLPSFSQVAQFSLAATPSIAGVPVLILAYPIYIVLCISLSLDAVLRPGPSARVMGDLARRRARPWLAGTALLLLVVSLLVTAVMVWVVLTARSRPPFDQQAQMAVAVGWFDLIIAGLIGLTVILIGQAVAAYEVFTGKTLPRRGLLRQWRNAVALAAGYGLVVGWSLALELRPVYTLLLTALIMTGFYALFSWRTYIERDRYIRHLRPFVTSQHLYEHLLDTQTGAAPPEVDVATPFGALCRDVLGARSARLMARGALAPLVPPVAYPGPSAPGPALPAWPEADEAAMFASPHTMCLPVDPERYGGAVWAVPLWSERGPIGLLLLGEKVDGGLYTQEEIEIARASGERLIDTRAGAELAQRLMALQRQRLAESQVLDHRARRVLHDDVLPELHAAMLGLNGAAESSLPLLANAHRRIADLLRDLPGAAAPAVARAGLFPALRRAIEDEVSAETVEVTWQVEPEAEEKSRGLPPLTAETLFFAAREAARNAARHGRAGSAGPLRLSVCAEWRDGLKLVIEDDGAGGETNSLAGGGSGQGLALHSTLMAVIGGTLSAEPIAGGMRVTLRLAPAAGLA